MIPRWQWASIIMAVLAVIAGAIYLSPNSYGHLFLMGRCNHEPMPYGCHPRRG